MNSKEGNGNGGLLQQKLDVSILRAETLGSGADQHTEYIVEVRVNETRWQVSRRYSQFYDFHARLRKAVADRNRVPECPPKKLQNSDARFIEKRRAALEEFLRGVLSYIRFLNPALIDADFVVRFFAFREGDRYNVVAERRELDIFGAIALHAADRLADCLRADPGCVNRKNLEDGGQSPLHAAASAGSPDMVEKLLQAGALVHSRDSVAWTPLHAAASSGNARVVEMLLERMADGGVDAQTSDGSTALHFWAANARDPAPIGLIQMMLDKGLAVNVRNRAEETPLHRAALAGRSEVAAQLLQCGADPDAREGAMGETPLHWAARAGHKETCFVLLRNGASAEIDAACGRAIAYPIVQEALSHVRKQMRYSRSRELAAAASSSSEREPRRPPSFLLEDSPLSSSPTLGLHSTLSAVENAVRDLDLLLLDSDSKSTS